MYLGPLLGGWKQETEGYITKIHINFDVGWSAN